MVLLRAFLFLSYTIAELTNILTFSKGGLKIFSYVGSASLGPYLLQI